MNGWYKYVVAVLFGYLIFSRSFAYLGIPSLYLFIGEVTLFLFVISLAPATRQMLISWLKPPSVFSGLVWAQILLLGYGVFAILYGVLVMGNPIRQALQIFAQNYYSLYLLVGLWLGLRQSEQFPARFFTALAVANSFFGLLAVALNNQWIHIPFAPLQELLSNTPRGTLESLLGLLFFTRFSARTIPVFALNLLVFWFAQSRADWFAFVVGFTVWIIVNRQYLFFLRFAGAAVVVLVILGWAGIELEAAKNMELSVQSLVARLVAPINLDLAYQLVGDPAFRFAGTFSWRTNWWNEIFQIVHVNWQTALFGLGYGYPLSSLIGYSDQVRSPHNIWFFLLAYGGWLAVAIYLAFHVNLFRLLWKAFRHSGVAFGVAIWLAAMINGLSGNYFETPHGAIPLYIILGTQLVPLYNRIYASSPGLHETATHS